MTPSLRILLGVVIVLAILHAVLRVRARAIRRQPAPRSRTSSRPPDSTATGPLPADPVEALERLHRVAQSEGRGQA